MPPLISFIKTFHLMDLEMANKILLDRLYLLFGYSIDIKNSIAYGNARRIIKIVDIFLGQSWISRK